MNFQNNVFLLFSIIGTSVNVLDLVRCVISLTVENASPVILISVNLLYYLCINFLPICYLMYCFALVNFFHIKNNIPRNFSFILVPLIISTTYIIVSSFLGISEYSVFYVIEGTSLVENGKIGYPFIYISGLCYFFAGARVILHYRKTLERAVLVHMVLSINLLFGSVVAQFLFPYARIISLALSMFLLDLSFYIQRSESYYDNVVECLNKDGFKKYLEHLFIRHDNFHVYSISMDDAAFYHNALGEKDRTNLELCIISALKTNYRNKKYSVYKIKFGTYAFIVKNPADDDNQKVTALIRNQIDLRWGFSALELALSFRVCQMCSGSDIKAYLEVSDLIGYIESNKKFKGQFIKASELDLIHVHSHSYLEDAIRKGLRENRFEVYYQPIYSSKDGILTGAEALIRLRDDNGNFVSPEDFIPIAEHNGTIFEIGKFVFTSVCKTLSEIDLNNYKLKKVDINLSVIQCIQEDMHKQLNEIRRQYDIPASLINIEITETASTNSPEVLLKNMKFLENDGIELSLDDYGSGNSNIAYIMNLPFKMIKIDKEIVWKAFENPQADIVLKSTIDMIKSLGLIVLAEGVETGEQASHLMEIGCDYLQGYFYSRPLPVQQFLEMMKK